MLLLLGKRAFLLQSPLPPGFQLHGRIIEFGQLLDQDFAVYFMGLYCLVGCLRCLSGQQLPVLRSLREFTEFLRCGLVLATQCFRTALCLPGVLVRR